MNDRDNFCERKLLFVLYNCATHHHQKQKGVLREQKSLQEKQLELKLCFALFVQFKNELKSLQRYVVKSYILIKTKKTFLMETSSFELMSDKSYVFK